MQANAPLLTSQRVAQICLFIFAAMALLGGALQMYLGEPETTPRLDNVHRFMAGTYFGAGMICLWAGATIRRQSTLVFLLAAAVFLASTGRLISISKVGLPEPGAVWVGYLIPQLVLPWGAVAAQVVTNRRLTAS